jgi:hypothetical protein
MSICPNARPEKESGEKLPAVLPSGNIDLSLIDMLRVMSVEERLRLNDRTINTILDIRNGFERRRAR